jgi:hypothetical protein
MADKPRRFRALVIIEDYEASSDASLEDTREALKELFNDIGVEVSLRFETFEEIQPQS